jgi:hypothetical protein
MAGPFEVPLNLTPKHVEFHGSFEIAAWLSGVRMGANHLPAVKRAGLFQNPEVIDFSLPERSVFVNPADIQQLPRYSQCFQQPDALQGRAPSCWLV